MSTPLRLALLVLVTTSAFALGATDGYGAATKAASSAAFQANAVSYAKHFVGVPYRYGGSSPRSGFDCSGFTSFVYRHFGIEIPRTTYAQFAAGRPVARKALRPGDLVFFHGLGHVGMYVGKGRFIHSPRSGKRVHVASLSEGWYRTRYVGARRLVRAPAPLANVKKQLRRAHAHLQSQLRAA